MSFAKRLENRPERPETRAILTHPAGDRAAEAILWGGDFGSLGYPLFDTSHLGAHLGHGGRVQGDIVICPFHGLGFNPAGECVRAPAGTTPPRAQLDLHPTIERNCQGPLGSPQ